jgi:hypothetical protein
MKATVTTAPWLGIRKDAWSRELFPEGMLNENQIRTLMSVKEGSRYVTELYLPPAILKMTDEIVEIHARFGHGGSTDEVVFFWLDNDGNMLASVIEKYEGPSGVHKPGDTYRKWAVAYLRTPEMRPFEQAYAQEHDFLWGLGRDGAVEKTRQFIHDTWVTDNNNDKE